MNKYSLYASQSLTQNSSGGQLLKWWVGDNLVKTPSYNSFGRMWLFDAISEVIISKLCEDIGIIKFVKYNLCEIEITDRFERVIGCECKNFESKDKQFLSIASITERQGNIVGYNISDISAFKYVENILNKMCGDAGVKLLHQMICLDWIDLNIDRHCGNFGILHNGTTEVAPVFDNGASLFSIYDVREFEYTNELAKTLKAKPFSFNFDRQLQFVDKGIIRDIAGKDISNTIKYISKCEHILGNHRTKFVKDMLIQRMELLNTL